MKLYINLMFSLILLLVTFSCGSWWENTNSYKVNLLTQNNEFKVKLDEYIDALGDDFDNKIVLVVCEQRNDSLIINMGLNGGFNDLICWQDQFVDYLTYRDCKVVLLNDFPNGVVALGRSKRARIESVFLDCFPKEYEKYKQDSLVGPPWMIDGESVELIFRQKYLILDTNALTLPHFIKRRINPRILEHNQWLIPDTNHYSCNDNYISDSTVMINVSELPKFYGGRVALDRFFAQKIIYPKDALEKRIEGKVYVQLIIDEKGRVINVQCVRGIGGGCVEEAIRIAKLLPNWIPAKNDGKTVKVAIAIPIEFKIGDKSMKK